MIKIATIAAVVAFAIAAPASASEIRVSTAGKTVAQLDAEITTAARTVCKRDIDRPLFYRSAFESCVKTSMSEAKLQLQKYAAAEGLQYAQR